jgi:hypothetical protein
VARSAQASRYLPGRSSGRSKPPPTVSFTPATSASWAARRAYAKDDSDFDPIRDEAAFKELIGR